MLYYTACDRTCARYKLLPGVRNGNEYDGRPEFPQNYSKRHLLHSKRLRGVTLDYLGGTTLEITGGRLTDDYENAIITAGSIFRTNDDESYFVLESTGTYTLNGVTLTTTKDNTQVELLNYNAVVFEADSGIIYNGVEQGEAATLTADTGIELNNSLEATVLTGTALNDTITNEGSNVTINALGGDDEIINVDSGGVLINAGSGNDEVTNLLNYSTVTGASDFEGVSIVGGSGNDSIHNIGGNRASIVSGAGDDYISNRHGYYPTISAGEGNDFIRISNGHYQNIDAGAGDDTITADAEAFTEGDWAMGGYATLLGGDGNDLITPIYSNNAYIDGGAGDDTIITNGKDSTITGGTGNNFISLTSAETGTAEGVVLALVEGENSTVEGFKGITADGEADTLYFVDGVINKAVDFTSEGLSFWTDTVMGGSDYLKVTFPNITDTTLINLKHGTKEAEVIAFINDGDIYQASIGTAKEYIGAVDGPNQGVSFEGISDDLDIALDVAGSAIEFWNIHSIIGGDGNTTITGTDSDDTLAAGRGQTTIKGNGGDDVLIGNSQTRYIDGGAGNDYIEVTNGEGSGNEGMTVIASAGNDTIQNYSSVITLKGDFTEASIDGANVILTTSDGSLTVIDGAGETLNINGDESVIGGEADSAAAAYLADFMLHKTEAGYPQMAALAFHPTEANPEAPTNYYSSETWTTTSADDLQLSAVHYSPEKPTGKWVILVHGYGKIGEAMNNFAEPYLAQGVDVLVVDQRAAGKSEGEWLTMGVAEAADIAIWTQEIEKTNSNAQITLHGVSMGAATVMMAAALSQTTNVTAMIEDCGYGNIADVLIGLLTAYGSNFGITGSLKMLSKAIFAVGETLTGYDVSQAAPINSIAQVTVPSLFIHGTADGAIPVSNAADLYNASGAESKTLLTIEGADHARSAYVDSVTYLSAVTTLLEDSTEEIGALTSSTVDNKLIRGTIYDDTITSAGDNVTIEGGTGNDFISLKNAGDVVLALVEGENSTVEGFKGVGDSEADTLYFVDGVINKAVDFTSEGLSFWTDTVMGGSDYLKVALADINDTTLLKLKYGSEAAIVEAFVNDGDIYNVTDGAADIYVGAVATHNQGLSFAGAGGASVTVDGLFGNGNINNTYTTIENFETLIGDSNTTFIIGDDTLKAADSLSAVTIKSSEDGTSTVTGVGDWNLNDNTVTLNSTSSLVSGESGLEVLTAGMIAYAAATLVSDMDKIIYSDTAESLKGSSKNENIIVSNNKYLDISSGGEDTICLTNADTVTIKGYDAKSGSTFLTNTSENLTNLIMYGDPYLLVVGDGYFKADNLGKVVLDGTDTIDGTFVNFTVLNEGREQLYGWSGQAGGNVDGSEYTQDAIIIGVAPSGYSTLKGGDGNDTIYAAADDVVNLSGGNDLIDIDHLDREWRINGNIGGLTINLGDGNISAQTTVKGFDTSQDKIALDDIGELSVDSSGDNLKIAVNNSSLTFAAGTEQLMITDDSGTYTIHTAFDNLTPTSAYIIETSDGTLETLDKGLKKKDNEYTYSSGGNTITGFNFGADESADELIIDSEITEVTFDEAGNLKVKVDEDNQLQISNAANKIIKVNANEQDWVVEFGNNLMYNESVNCYGDNTDTRLWVHKDYSGEGLAILANGLDGKVYNNVKEITASAYAGEATLFGNELENVITASKGSSSLWGGEGSDNDTLIGSSGYDEFFYLKGNGNDVIRHAEGNDLINLLDINLEDISSASMNALSIKIEFTDGGSLSINTLSDLTFQLADGSKWQSDKNHKTWISK